MGIAAAAMPVDEFSSRFESLAGNVAGRIHGQDDVITLALVCFFAGGHLLVEGVPGVAKTTLARAIANSVSAASVNDDGSGTQDTNTSTPPQERLDVRRIQFTPDLLPSDVTGTMVYHRERDDFTFHRGPVFTNVLLADEINRASPKTQSALLEVMAEGQVTVAGKPEKVPWPFLCIATQNPVDHQGVYELPEAQLDRFMMKLAMDYPADAEAEERAIDGMIARRLSEESVETRSADEVEPVLSLADVRGMFATVRTIELKSAVRQYIVRLVRATRPHQRNQGPHGASGNGVVPGVEETVRLGASPRAGIALALAAQAFAAASGERTVTDDHVKRMAPHVLGHRLIVGPGSRNRDAAAGEVLRAVLDRVEVPAWSEA